MSVRSKLELLFQWDVLVHKENEIAYEKVFLINFLLENFEIKFYILQNLKFYFFLIEMKFRFLVETVQF